MDKFKATGSILLIYFAGVLASRFIMGFEHNLWWLSHAALLLAGIGFLYRNEQLLTASLCLVFIPHLLWIIDIALLLTGLPTFGVGDYIRHADTLTMVFTLHHVFLIPLLIWACIKLGVSEKGWLYASAYFAVITLGAILTTNPDYNVNCAFRVCEALIAEPVYFLNQLSPPLYWLAENLIAALFLFLPVNSALLKWLPQGNLNI